MASYKAWLKRKENATPYANKANCRKCRYGEWVRTSAFCNVGVRSKKIPYKQWAARQNYIYKVGVAYGNIIEN